MLGLAKRKSQAKVDDKVTRLKAEKSGKNLVALFAFISIVFSGLSLLAQFIVLGTTISIAKKPAPSLVQLSDGQAIKVQAIGSTERSPDVVQHFTTDFLTMLMSWNGEIPNGNDGVKTDPGALVTTKSGEKRITTAAFQAGFALSDQLRSEIIKMIGEMTPQEIFQGKLKTALKFQQVTIPVQTEPGQWKITVIATLIKYQRGRADTVKVPFNKQIIVRAVDTPPLPQNGKFSNELEMLVYTIRQAGLEVISMKDVETSTSPPKAEANPQPSATNSTSPAKPKAAASSQPSVKSSVKPAN